MPVKPARKSANRSAKPAKPRKASIALPTKKSQVQDNMCDVYKNLYGRMYKPEKQKWLRAASGPDGALRISFPPDDASTIQINLWDANSGSYAGCSWIDKDPLD